MRTFTVVGPSSSWERVTTPSTLELPLRTATAFLVTAKTVRRLGAVAAESVKDWGAFDLRLRETPWKEEWSEGEELVLGAVIGNNKELVVLLVEVKIVWAAIDATEVAKIEMRKMI